MKDDELHEARKALVSLGDNWDSKDKFLAFGIGVDKMERRELIGALALMSKMSGFMHYTPDQEHSSAVSILREMGFRYGGAGRWSR